MTLALPILAVALVHALVGQVGASGCLAVMGVTGLEPAAKMVTALTPNLVVAGLVTWQSGRVGLLSSRAAGLCAVLGVPFPLLGGATSLPARACAPWWA